MFARFLEKQGPFNTIGSIPLTPSEQVAAMAPIALHELWTRFGLSTAMDGYLKLVNPADWHHFLHESYDVFAEPALVFAATAMADLFIWEMDCVKQINYRMGTTKIHGPTIEGFFNLRLSRWDIIEPSMQGAHFRPALERLGPCAYDECYAYVPALAFGGSERVENLHKVKLREHLAILSQMVGRIE